MISILSPAKTLDMATSERSVVSSIRFPKETSSIVKELKKYGPAKLGSLMKISDKLALLNSDRNQAFTDTYDMDNSKEAIFAFKGGVYMGLGAEDFDEKELNFAQSNVRLLSGLYGLLRPLDLMQAYRLEMGTKLKLGKHKNLYEFWGDKITNQLQEDINSTGSNILINLASNEYFKAVNQKVLEARIINIVFKEYRDDKLKFISFNAKKARGLMTRYIVKNKIVDYNDLQGFNYEGYYYDDKLSTEHEWMFVK